ncbi:MAG: biotin/lipoyl-binding protein [Euryarchaeota archaeon]|nr:biotin/lipoyl-binding protein [Euryarchaeota archaeon]MBT4981563.1 biotin/lipoyl-binding protein [Euryarchaeota archaeon]MBT5184009.1 biotin/lipoyl-binding protein [Euryarchaeota archaeon]
MGETRKVIVNGEEFEVELEQNGDTWTATVGGQSFDITVPDAGPAPKQRRAAGGKSQKSGKVNANIPGKVVTVEVALGDEVEEGQVVMILEAMKMQNEIQAPISGTVTEIHCEEGQSIEANIPLLVITPPESEDES